MSSVIKSIRKASTVLVARPKNNGSDYELLFVKRSSKSRFMPGALVFPGGVQDKEDVDARYCALRELFEETGLLLDSKCRRVNVPQSEKWRSIVMKDPARFSELLSSQKVSRQPLSSLRAFARWTTPRVEPRRFDTLFFLLPIESWSSNDDPLRADGGETTQAQWLSPQSALELHSKSMVAIAPPTWFVLNQLISAGSLNHFISSCESIDQLEHVLASPQLLESGNIAICLPGDELYDEQSNKEVPLPPTKGVHRRIVIHASAENDREGRSHGNFAERKYEFDCTIPSLSNFPINTMNVFKKANL